MKVILKLMYIGILFLGIKNVSAQSLLNLELICPDSSISIVKGEEFIIKGKISVPGTRVNNIKVWAGASDAWWDEADELVWIFSDVQPEDNPGYVDPWGRLAACVEDINSLPLTADYVIGAGDITNPHDVTDKLENIRKTHEFLKRISWFKSKPEEGAVIVAGNHEWGSVSDFADYFGPSDKPDRLFSAEFGNFIIYGLTSNDDNNDYSIALNTLKNKLQKLKASGNKKNVMLVFHFTVANTVNNCHYLPDPPNLSWGRPFMHPDSIYDEITKEYGSEYIVATFTGDIHSSWKDPNTTPHAIRNGVTHINTGIFGDRAIHSDINGNCYGDDDGLGESQFMALKYGESKATLYKRQSWYDKEAPDGGNTDLDHEKDGEGINDIKPHWFYEDGYPWTINPDLSVYSKDNYSFPLAYPAITPTRNVIIRQDSARFLTDTSKYPQPVILTSLSSGKSMDLEWRVQASPDLEPGNYTLYLKAYSENIKAIESKRIVIHVRD